MPARIKVPLYKQKKGSLRIDKKLGDAFSQFTHPFHGMQAEFFRNLHEQILVYEADNPKRLLHQFFTLLVDGEEIEKPKEHVVISYYAPDQDYDKVKKILVKYKSSFFRYAIWAFLEKCKAERNPEDFLLEFFSSSKRYPLEKYIPFLEGKKE